MLVPFPDVLQGGLTTDPEGTFEVGFAWPSAPLETLWIQAWILAPGEAWTASNGLAATPGG